MITKKRNNLFLLLILACAFSICLPSFADTLSDKTLQDDLNYYRQQTKEKNLDSNGRAYILNRIEKKYNASSVDTTPVKLELEKLEGGVSTVNGTAAGEGKMAAPEETGGPASSASAAEDAVLPIASDAVSGAKHTKALSYGDKGKVEKIFVSESKTESKIIIAASDVSRSNYFLMKDPSSGKPPKIILDLYGVRSKLSTAAGNISPKTGLFSNVSSGQFEGPPNNVVRIAAELRREAPYTVNKEGELWVIRVDKTVPAQAPQGKDAESPAVSAAEPATTVLVPSVAVSSSPAAQPELAMTPSAPDKIVKNTNGDYHIENGDILGVVIYPADELSREVIVQPDGSMPFPLIGSARAKGLTVKQLETSLGQELGRYIAAPQVTITIKQFISRQLFITGEVKGVGAYNFKENLRLMEFISSIGGFTDSANRREVKIYRGPPTKRQTYTVNVEELVKSGDFSKDFLLEPGDIIEVQKGQAKIAILGDIRNPGYYDYKENMHLIELVSLAGGFTDSAKITDVSVIHQGGESNAPVMKVNLKKILSGSQKDVLVQSGDTVYVPKGKLESAGWFLNNILPWLTLVSLIFVIRAGI